MNKKVIVAMSGGVDSSVAAALLKKQGYTVIGLYLRLFKDVQKEKQVKKIAKAIKIPLIIKDVCREFRKKIIDYFIREYKIGCTPNPCVVCNQEIKFKFLFEELARIKADYVVTGHYARIIKYKTSKMKQKIYKLFEAKDKNKDQSYFLYTLNQKQLARILFPLGNYKKEETRKLANKLKVPVKNKEESQNVCFIADKNPDLFLRRNIQTKKGKIIDTQGNVLGEHEGLFLYTLGQRRGVKIGGRGPYYVVEKDYKKNILLVTNNAADPSLYKKEAIIQNVNWIAKKPKLPFKTLVRNRYHDPLIYAKILAEGRGYKIKYSEFQRAITPGQSAVFYAKNREVIGGGVIK